MKEKKGEHPLGDAGQIIAFFIFIIIWVADSFLFDLTTQITAYVPFYLRMVITIIVIAISLYLLNASHKVVAGEHRPERVISDGVFKYIRHPLYMSAVLFYLALTVSTLSIISFALWLGILVFYNYLASYEEKLMISKFGDEYVTYRQRTGKWLPKF